MMKMKCLLAAQLVVPSLAMSATARARTNELRGLLPACKIPGREVAAAPWSAACMTDHGPRQFAEPCGSTVVPSSSHHARAL